MKALPTHLCLQCLGEGGGQEVSALAPGVHPPHGRQLNHEETGVEQQGLLGTTKGSPHLQQIQPAQVKLHYQQ